MNILATSVFRLQPYILLVLCLFSATLFAQSSSVQKALSDCELLNKKIEEEQNENIWNQDNKKLKQTVLFYLKNPKLTVAQKKQFQKFYSIAMLNQGAFNTLSGQYKTSIENYKRSFALAKSIDYYDGCASSLQNIGTSFDYLGKIDSSLVYFKKALHFAQLSKSETTIAYVLTDLGYVYNNLGDNEQAISYNLKAYKLFNKLKDYEGLERTSFSIGRIFDNLKEYEKSLKYYNSALQISEKSGNEQRQCLNLNSIANIYFVQKKYEASKKLLDKCLKLCLQNNYTSISGVCYNLMGDIAFETQRFEMAKMNYQKASAIFKNQANGVFYSKTRFKLAQTYLKEQNIPRAEQYALEGYNLCIKNNYPSETRAICALLSEIYTQQKKYKSALDFKTIAYKISDSIYYDENKNIALKAEYKYHSSLKEARIKALSQDKKIAFLESQKQRNIVLLLTITLVSLLISAYFFFNRYKTQQQNHLLKVQLEEAQKTHQAKQNAVQSELKALRSQMNPHFIFNALNSIQEQFMYGNRVLANEQMGNFTALTRQILNVSRKKSIPIATEVDLLTKYLELEKMRFEDDFSYEITCSDAVDEDYHQIPPMLIQPLVENSIKHGLLHQAGAKSVQVHFYFEQANNSIVCTVQDNGIGREKAAAIQQKNTKNHQSFATQATEQRLELLDGQKSSMVYEDLFDDHQNVCGTRVTVSITLR